MFVKRSLRLIIPGFIVLLTAAIVCSILFFRNPYTPAAWTYKIVNTFDHDPKAFTQGLVFEDGFLYEGTGLYGESVLRKVELETGNVLQEHKLQDEFLERVDKDQGQLVFVAMSVPDYELMAYNMQELKRYINELKEVVVYYRKVTTSKEE